ncbi:hypothetical protein GCM10022288_01570 [Gryllotalpicola kribbensis]|uniref:Uncharacterized protein n=2 Tax=Gryllotalpicola kribbensis TaxID=993084 RepID=A0ABP8AF38_9MICO
MGLHEPVLLVLQPVTVGGELGELIRFGRHEPVELMVQLSHTLNWLLDYVKANGPKYLIQVIEGVRTGKLVTYTNSGDSLNAINHNHHFLVDPDQAFSMWASIDSIMRYVMKP